MIKEIIVSQNNKRSMAKIVTEVLPERRLCVLETVTGARDIGDEVVFASALSISTEGENRCGDPDAIGEWFNSEDGARFGRWIYFQTFAAYGTDGRSDVGQEFRLSGEIVRAFVAAGMINLDGLYNALMKKREA